MLPVWGCLDLPVHPQLPWLYSHACAILWPATPSLFLPSYLGVPSLLPFKYFFPIESLHYADLMPGWDCADLPVRPDHSLLCHLYIFCLTFFFPCFKQAFPIFLHLQLGSLYPATHIIAIWEGMNHEAMTAVANLLNTSPIVKGMTVVQHSFFGGLVSNENFKFHAFISLHSRVTNTSTF